VITRFAARGVINPQHVGQRGDCRTRRLHTTSRPPKQDAKPMVSDVSFRSLTPISAEALCRLELLEKAM